MGELVSKALQIQAYAGMLYRLGRTDRWDQGEIHADWVRQVVSYVPTTWVQAALLTLQKVMSGTIVRPGLNVAMAVILPRLGWRLKTAGQSVRVVSLARLSVRHACALQMGDSCEQRLHARKRFILQACARGEGSEVTEEEHLQLGKLLKLCWALVWENKQKDVFWRLTVDGFADGKGWAVERVCACGGLDPKRSHFLWDCPVAQAVVRELRGCWPEMGPVSKAHLWLMQDRDNIPVDSWKVACLAALSGMDFGRRKLVAFKLASRGGQGDDDPDYGVPADGPHGVFWLWRACPTWGYACYASRQV